MLRYYFNHILPDSREERGHQNVPLIVVHDKYYDVDTPYYRKTTIVHHITRTDCHHY